MVFFSSLGFCIHYITPQELQAALAEAEEKHKKKIEEMEAKVKAQEVELSELMAEKLRLTDTVQEDLMMQAVRVLSICCSSSNIFISFQMHHEEELAIIREGIQAELNMKEEVCHI
jgi:tyrosine-protein phosphatase YwqE